MIILFLLKNLIPFKSLIIFLDIWINKELEYKKIP